MTRERDIIHENGIYWVHADRDGSFSVFRNGVVNAVSDSTYDDKSLAVARCDYLAKRKAVQK